MTSTQRIVLNTLATYGRSLFSMILGLFSARWVLQALGQTDFGLYGVVGCIIVFITFLSGVMTVSVSRFYAFSIGVAHNMPPEEAHEDLKKWFNTALSIHLVLPALLIVLGYTIGVYAIQNWLAIPLERIPACVVVFQIALITAFVNMFSVPFVAMYTAHQHIAELSIFGFLSSCFTFLGSYLLLGVQTDRLITYATYMMLIYAGIPVLQIIYAVFKFKACRFQKSYLFEKKKLKELFSFVGWKMFGGSCVMLRSQGSVILINLFFGPKVNAAYNVANQVSSQTSTLSASLIGALQPAITTMEGKGERNKMLEFALQTCKMSSWLVMLFAVPLIVEIKNVLRLWLVNPPEYTSGLCTWMLVILLADNISVGHMLAIAAQGKIAVYEKVQGLLLFLAFPLTWLFFKLGFGPTSIGFTFFVTTVFYSFGRVYFCKRQLDMNPIMWVQRVVLPVFLLMVCSLGTGFLPSIYMAPTFIRVCLTTIITGCVITFLGWFVLFNSSERSRVMESVKRMLRQDR